ncbi:hypothetical protein N136_03795, partial [Leifsonia aquatica ATCC 14665]
MTAERDAVDALADAVRSMTVHADGTADRAHALDLVARAVTV